MQSQMSFYTISGALTHGIGMVMPGPIKEPSASLWALGFIKTMTVDQTITEHMIKFGYYTFFFWSILVISLTTGLALLWGLWYHKDD